jgi:alkylated DNA repair dioxygenase AlkB
MPQRLREYTAAMARRAAPAVVELNSVTVMQAELFTAAPPLPEGFVYQAGFLAVAEEDALLDVIRTLPFEAAKYKEYTAKRRTVSYGSQYDFSANRMRSAPEVPQFLFPLRARIAAWVGVAPEQFVHALVSEYRPGVPLGWHRDVPEFDVIVGVSLGGRCRMRLRPYRPEGENRRQDVLVLELEPRSAYVIRDHARWGWQHSIAPTQELRYSITLRTARRARAN